MWEVKPMHFDHNRLPRRAFGLLLLLISKAFHHARRPKPVKRNRKMVALIISLVVVLVVMPAIATAVAAIAHAWWKAAHPEQTIVPDLTGSDRRAAETAIRNAQLQPFVSFTTIKDKCWQEQPAPNTVIDQDPPPITPVSINSKVRVVIGFEQKTARLQGQSP
jgi:hypothetical protein